MRVFGLLSVILVLGAGFYVMQQSAMGTGDGASPQEQVDVVSIRQHLLVIGQAERQYVATHGTFATVPQLEAEHLLPSGAEVRGYEFSAVTRGARGFTVTATPIDPMKIDWPMLEIDEGMQVVER